MTSPGGCERAVSDPIGLITELVAVVEHQLTREQIGAVAAAVAGGRAKSRRLASALAERPGVLADGRSPAPRAVGDLLVALRRAGARSVSPPRCARCGKQLRTFQRRGQDWYCAGCGPRAEPCAACGNTRPVSSRDRAGQPRCARCPDTDGRDPVTVIYDVIAGLDPHTSRDAVAAAVRGSAPRPSYQQKLAWALEERPGLLTGEGHLAPLRAIPRFIEELHAAGVAGIVRPACPGCHRVVRIDKPLNGVRVCRMCIAVLPLPGTPDPDPLYLRPDHAVRHLPRHRTALVPSLPAPDRCLLSLRPPRADHLWHPGRSALRRLHRTRALG